jgi:Flp pilus assembly protein TadB
VPAAVAVAAVAAIAAIAAAAVAAATATTRRESRRERPSLDKLKSSLTSSFRRSGKRLSETAASALEEPSEHTTSGNASDTIKSQIRGEEGKVQPSSKKCSLPSAVAKSSSK